MKFFRKSAILVSGRQPLARRTWHGVRSSSFRRHIPDRTAAHRSLARVASSPHRLLRRAGQRRRHAADVEGLHPEQHADPRLLHGHQRSARVEHRRFPRAKRVDRHRRRTGRRPFHSEPDQCTRQWGSVTAESAYITAALAVMESRSFYSTHGVHYIAGYGAGGTALQNYVANNPLNRDRCGVRRHGRPRQPRRSAPSSSRSTPKFSADRHGPAVHVGGVSRRARAGVVRQRDDANVAEPWPTGSMPTTWCRPRAAPTARSSQRADSDATAHVVQRTGVEGGRARTAGGLRRQAVHAAGLPVPVLLHALRQHHGVRQRARLAARLRRARRRDQEPDRHRGRRPGLEARVHGVRAEEFQAGLSQRRAGGLCVRRRQPAGPLFFDITRWWEIADRYGFIVVVPCSQPSGPPYTPLETRWNFSNGNLNVKADDFEFIRQLIQVVDTAYDTDPGGGLRSATPTARCSSMPWRTGCPSTSPRSGQRRDLRPRRRRGDLGDSDVSEHGGERQRQPLPVESRRPPQPRDVLAGPKQPRHRRQPESVQTGVGQLQRTTLYRWNNDQGIPLYMYGITAARNHNVSVDTAWTAWEEWFSNWSKDRAGNLHYEGRLVQAVTSPLVGDAVAPRAEPPDAGGVGDGGADRRHRRSLVVERQQRPAAGRNAGVGQVVGDRRRIVATFRRAPCRCCPPAMQ